jgi:hypothetical protein
VAAHLDLAVAPPEVLDGEIVAQADAVAGRVEAPRRQRSDGALDEALGGELGRPR